MIGNRWCVWGIWWLLLLVGMAIGEQMVLDGGLSVKDRFEEAQQLLEPYRSKELEFGRLDYNKVLTGEHTDSRPHLELDVDHVPLLRQLKYERRMNSLNGNKTQALKILSDLSDQDDVESTLLLAQINMFGNFSIPRNDSQALKYYEKLARLAKDNASVHYMLGFIYATGLFGEVEQNQAKALMHYQTSHELGDLRATMVLAYRYFQGISVEKNCGLALYYYSAVAQKSLQYVLDGPIGGPNIDSYAVRIQDFTGGLYGSKASEQPTSMTRSGNDHLYDRNIFNEINIDPEDHRSVELLYEAKAYYNGDYFHKRDYDLAFKVANKCALNGEHLIKWSTDVSVDEIFVSRCYSLLGHMYLRGEGTRQNYTEALKWHTKANNLASSSSVQVDLGLIYEFGLGLDAPAPHVAKLYYQKAETTSTLAKFHLARQYLAEGQIPKGFEAMQLAAYGGNDEALYHLSTLYERGIGGVKSCEDNVVSYKAFVERIEPVVSVLEWAFKQAFLAYDPDLALIGYAMAAEQGYEVAQSSVGFLLYAPVPISESLPVMPEKRFEAALTYYGRSSRQYNIDSTVFLGDLYYYGVRVPTEDGFYSEIPPDYKKAFHYYQEASNRHSKQGSFNIAYMYELGLGVPKDLHLAKRYYDLALLGRSSDLYLPVTSALLKLKVKMLWSKFTGSGDPDDLINKDLENKPRSWNDWKELYKSIRRSENQRFISEDFQDSGIQQLVEEQNTEVEFSESVFVDVIFLLIIILTFAFVMHVNNRRRRAAAALNNNENNGGGDNGNRPNFQFNFMIIPI